MVSEYKKIHPKRKILEAFQGKGKSEKNLLFAFFGSIVFYMVFLWRRIMCGILVSLLVLARTGWLIIVCNKKVKATYTKEQYEKRNIQPLRQRLQKVRIYSAGEIEYLIEIAERYSKKKTKFEQFLKYKLPVQIVIEYYIVIGIALLLDSFGAINIEKINPTAQDIFVEIGKTFLQDQNLGVLIIGLVLIVLVLSSVLCYSVWSVMEDFWNNERECSQALIDDLKYILMDFNDISNKKTKDGKDGKKNREGGGKSMC